MSEDFLIGGKFEDGFGGGGKGEGDGSGVDGDEPGVGEEPDGLTGGDGEVRKIGIAMKGREIHNLDGKITFQPYGVGHQANYSVSRGGLNCLLMDLAEKQGVKFFFNEKCTNVDLKNTTCTFENTETKKITEIKSDRIFGTDGAFSAARTSLKTVIPGFRPRKIRFAICFPSLATSSRSL